MKFGIVALWRDSVEDFVQEVQAAERHGMDLLGVGDSQAGYRELYVSLAVAAAHTQRIKLGPMVTNPVTRHPAVTASAIASIDRLSGGRATLGIGTGGSAVWTIGQPPARIADLTDYVQALRDLMREGSATYGGNSVTVQDVERPVPVLVSAEGPRALALAGALADGVILHAGTSPTAIDWCMNHLRKGAESVGRDVQELEIWMMLKASVADTREAALEAVRAGLAGSASHALRHGAADKGVPPELLEPVARLIDQYDASQHGVASSANADLVEKYGLTDFLAGYFGLVGTPEQCAQSLDALASHGIEGVICPASAVDPLALIHRLGDEVLPLVTSRAHAQEAIPAT